MAKAKLYVSKTYRLRGLSMEAYTLPAPQRCVWTEHVPSSEFLEPVSISGPITIRNVPVGFIHLLC